MNNEQDDDGVARRRRLREASCSEDLEAGQAIQCNEFEILLRILCRGSLLQQRLNIAQ